MKKRITSIEPGSLAEQYEIHANDIVLALNKKTGFDIIDYMLVTSEEEFELTIQNENDIKTIKIINHNFDPLGISFEHLTIDQPKRCANNCIFCFMKQMPRGLRDTLYFQDDDYRLSFLYGNYITLTNVTDADIDRIIKHQLSPMNISVHATDPDLRIAMTRNPKSNRIMAQLEKLKDGDIEFNVQLVLCPGYNDQEQLDKTLSDMLSLLPAIKSLSCVPVGLTKYRDGLSSLTQFDETGAKDVIYIIENYRKKAHALNDTHLFYASDEFFILANQPIPPDAYYDDYLQYENGVGIARSFMDEIDSQLQENEYPIETKDITLITGVLGYPILNEKIAQIKEKYSKIKLNTVAIENHFFGTSVTASGLVCGSDIIEQLKETDHANTLIIPSNMLKDDEDVFLDNITVTDLEQALNIHCIIAPFTGEGLLDILRKI